MSSASSQGNNAIKKANNRLLVADVNKRVDDLLNLFNNEIKSRNDMVSSYEQLSHQFGEYKNQTTLRIKELELSLSNSLSELAEHKEHMVELKAELESKVESNNATLKESSTKIEILEASRLSFINYKDVTEARLIKYRQHVADVEQATAERIDSFHNSVMEATNDKLKAALPDSGSLSALQSNLLKASEQSDVLMVKVAALDTQSKQVSINHGKLSNELDTKLKDVANDLQNRINIKLAAANKKNDNKIVGVVEQFKVEVEKQLGRKLVNSVFNKAPPGQTAEAGPASSSNSNKPSSTGHPNGASSAARSSRPRPGRSTSSLIIMHMPEGPQDVSEEEFIMEKFISLREQEVVPVRVERLGVLQRSWNSGRYIKATFPSDVAKSLLEEGNKSWLEYELDVRIKADERQGRSFNPSWNNGPQGSAYNSQGYHTVELGQGGSWNYSQASGSSPGGSQQSQPASQ